MRSAILAPPLASLLSEKSVLSYAYLNTSIVYPRYSSRSFIYLSVYRLSHIWACSIYLFRQYIISFWRSQSPYSQLYCKQYVKNASEMRWDLTQRTTVPIWRSLHERLEDCVARTAGSGAP